MTIGSSLHPLAGIEGKKRDGDGPENVENSHTPGAGCVATSSEGEADSRSQDGRSPPARRV